MSWRLDSSVRIWAGNDVDQEPELVGGFFAGLMHELCSKLEAGFPGIGAAWSLDTSTEETTEPECAP